MEGDKEKLISRKKQKKNLKEKREKMYQSINHECAKINTSEIRIEDFVESRKKELKNFNQILKNKYSSKTGFQLLPKHMRRRCMSHNPFRVPIRLRVGDIKTVIKTKQFKHKRKRRNLRKSILKRALLNNWFESHLWLVKRFKMKHKFGYLIPFKRRDKSFKACYRYFKHDAVVNDCSYFNYLTLKVTNKLENLNNEDIVLEDKNNNNLDFIYLIKLFLDKLTLNKDLIKLPIDTNIDNNCSNPSNQEEENKILDSLYLKNFETCVYNFETGKLIGPCTFIIFDCKLLLKFNALMANELTQNLLNFKNKLFNESQVFKNKNLDIYYSKSLNTYKLLGPRSGSRLFKILNSLSAFDALLGHKTQSNYENFEKFFSNETQFEKLLDRIPNGEILVFKIKKPSTEFKMNEFCFKTFYDKLIKLKAEEKHLSNSEEQSKMHLDTENNFNDDAEKIRENNKGIYTGSDDDCVKLMNQILSQNNKDFISEITQMILQEESIELTDLGELSLNRNKNKNSNTLNNEENKENASEEEMQKDSNNIESDKNNNFINNNNIPEKIATSLQTQKHRLINITQKKHLLRKFTAMLNTYTERGPLVHRRKLKLSDLNDKVEESLHIDKRKILDYLSLQRKSTQKNLSFANNKDNSESKLYKIVNNTITENINNYKIEDIKKILHSQSESYLIILKNGLINLKNNNNANGSVFTSVPVYDLIFPSGFSSDLLRRFHYIETKVIGLKELNYFLTECGQSIFPDDYPSTNAYCEYIKQKTLNKIGKYCKFPPSKRSNFQKLCNPFPFYAAWDTLGKNLKKWKKNITLNDNRGDENRMQIDFQNNSNSNSEANKNQGLIDWNFDAYFDAFNFHGFNANSFVIQNVKSKSNIKNQMEIQLLRNPKEKNLWVPIHFEMLAKGNPQYNSLVCLPATNDFNKIFEFLKYTKGKKIESNSMMSNKSNKIDFSKNKIINLLNNPLDKDFILSFESNKEIKNSITQNVLKTEIKNKDFNTEFKIYKDLLENDNLHKLKYNSNILDYNFNVKVDEGNLQRKIIGFVTSGQFSYTNHKGIGKGFIDLKSFEEILKIKKEMNAKITEGPEDSRRMENENNEDKSKFIEELVRLNLVLIRNPGSRNYYFAKFTY